jgi:hypothetical protein
MQMPAPARVKLNGGVARDGVLLADLRATPDSSVCLR